MNRRWFEAHPDNYVHFEQRQRLWAFSVNWPRMWAAYEWLASIRCLFMGHEFGHWETDKYISTPKTRRRCLFCGKEEVR